MSVLSPIPTPSGELFSPGGLLLAVGTRGVRRAGQAETKTGEVADCEGAMVGVVDRAMHGGRVVWAYLGESDALVLDKMGTRMRAASAVIWMRTEINRERRRRLRLRAI